MPFTVHDITMNADAFRRAYPRWPSAEPNPLDGPFLTGRELTDYSDDPEFAVSLSARPAPETSKTATAQRMSRLLAGLES